MDVATQESDSEYVIDYLHCPLCGLGFPDAPLLTHHIKSVHRDWTLYKVISKENDLHRIPGCEVLEEVDNINQVVSFSNENNDNNAVAAEISKVTVKHFPEVSLGSDILDASESDGDVEIIEPSSEGYYSWRQKTVPPIYDISVSDTESESGEETEISNCESNYEIFARSFQGNGYIKAEKSYLDVSYNETSDEYLRLFEEPDEMPYLTKGNGRRCEDEKGTVNKRSGKMFLGQKNFQKQRGGKIIIASVPSSRAWVDQGRSCNENTKGSMELEPSTGDRKVASLHRNMPFQKRISSHLGTSDLIPPSPNKLNLFDNSMNMSIINVAHGSTCMQSDPIEGDKFPAKLLDTSDCSIVAEGLGSYTTLSVIEQREPFNSNDIIDAGKMNTESSKGDCKATDEATTSPNYFKNSCQNTMLENCNDEMKTTDSSLVDLEEIVDMNKSIFRVASDSAGVKAVLTKEPDSVQSECVNHGESARTEYDTRDITRQSINQDISVRVDFGGFPDSDKQDSLNSSKVCKNLHVKNVLGNSTKELDRSLRSLDNFAEFSSSNRVDSNFVSRDSKESDSPRDLNDQAKNIDCASNTKENLLNAPNLTECDMMAKGSVNYEHSGTVSDSVRVDADGTGHIDENSSCASEQITLRDIEGNPMDSTMNQATKQIRPEPLVAEDTSVKAGSSKSDGTFAVPYYPSHRRLKRSYLSNSVTNPSSVVKKQKYFSRDSLGNLNNLLPDEVENVDRDRFGENVNLHEQEATPSRREQYVPCSSQRQDKNVSAMNPVKGNCKTSSINILEKSLDISSGVESPEICAAKKIVSIVDYRTLGANQSSSSLDEPENFASNLSKSACSGSISSRLEEMSDSQNLAEVYGLKTTASTSSPLKGYKCKKCLIDLGDCQSLKSHRCMAPSLKPFKCSICLFSFSRKRHLALHLQKCSRKRKRQTLVVQKSNDTEILKDKIESECFICFKRVNSKFQLVQHLFRFHADVVKQDTVKSRILSNLDITEDWASEAVTNCNLENDVENFQMIGNSDLLDYTDNYPEEDSHSVQDQTVTREQANSEQELIKRGETSPANPVSAYSQQEIIEREGISSLKNPFAANSEQALIERRYISSLENPLAVENVSKDTCENHGRKNSEDIIADMGPPTDKNILNDHEFCEKNSSESLLDFPNCQASIVKTLEEKDTSHDIKKSKEIMSDIMKYLSKDFSLAKQGNSAIPPSCKRSSAKLLVCMCCGKKFRKKKRFRSHLLDCVNNRAGHKFNISSKKELTDSVNTLNCNELAENTDAEGTSVPFYSKGSISTRSFYKKSEDLNEEESYESLCSSLFSGEQSVEDHPVHQRSTKSSKFLIGDDASATVETVRKQTSVCVNQTGNNAGVDEEPVTEPLIMEKITTEIQKIGMDPSSTFEKIDAPQEISNSLNIYQCIFCGKACASAYALRYHLLIFHNYRPGMMKNAKLYQCSRCSRRYSSKYTLKYHYDGCSSNINPNVCKGCGKAFGNKYSLTRHHKRCASSLSRNVDISVKASYKCFYCDRTYSSKYTLAYHLRKCKIVTSAYGDDEDIMASKKSELCVFKQQVEMSRNSQDIPKTEEQYKCFICGRNFRSYHSLYYHKVNVHSYSMKINSSESIPVKQEVCVRMSNFDYSTQTIDDAATCEKSCSGDPVSQEEKQDTCSQKGNYCKNDSVSAQYLVFNERRGCSPLQLSTHEEKQQTVDNCEKVSNSHIDKSMVNDFLGFTSSLVCRYCRIAFADALYFKAHLTKHRNRISRCGFEEDFELKVLVKKLDIVTSEGITRHVNLKKNTLTGDLGGVTMAIVSDKSQSVNAETVDNNGYDRYGGYFRTFSPEEYHRNRNGRLPYRFKKNYAENLCVSDVTSSGKKLNKLTKKLMFGVEVNCKSTRKFLLARYHSSGAQGKYIERSMRCSVLKCKSSAVQKKHRRSKKNTTFTNSKGVHGREKCTKSSVLKTIKAKNGVKASYGCSKCGKVLHRNDSECHRKVVHLCLPRYHCLECGKTFKFTSCLMRHFVYVHPGVKPLEGKTFSFGKS